MLVHRIKKDWKKYIKDCKGRSGCHVSATTKNLSVSLDGDALKLDGAFNAINAKHKKSSDCLLIEHDGVAQVGVIEFKSKWSDGPGAARQVLAGCQIAKSLLSHYKLKKYKIYLIVSADERPLSVQKQFFDEVNKSGEDIERAIVAGCHEKFKNLRSRKRNG